MRQNENISRARRYRGSGGVGHAGKCPRPPESKKMAIFVVENLIVMMKKLLLPILILTTVPFVCGSETKKDEKKEETKETKKDEKEEETKEIKKVVDKKTTKKSSWEFKKGFLTAMGCLLFIHVLEFAVSKYNGNRKRALIYYSKIVNLQEAEKKKENGKNFSFDDLKNDYEKEILKNQTNVELDELDD